MPDSELLNAYLGATRSSASALRGIGSRLAVPALFSGLAPPYARTIMTMGNGAARGTRYHAGAAETGHD